MWAASGDQVEVVTRLMEVQTIFRHQSSLASCLMCAVKRGHVATVRRLVAETRVPLDIANKAGVAPINFTEDKEIRNIIQTEAARYIITFCIFLFYVRFSIFLQMLFIANFRRRLAIGGAL